MADQSFIDMITTETSEILEKEKSGRQRRGQQVQQAASRRTRSLDYGPVFSESTGDEYDYGG